MGELLSSDGLETSGRGTGWVGPAAPPSDPVATMEAPLYAGAQPNAAGSDRTEGLDECDEWSWSVVEQRRVSYERGAAQAGVQWPVSGKLAGYDGSASVPAVNRRGTEPYARWCERTGEVTPPPTRSPREFPGRRPGGPVPAQLRTVGQTAGSGSGGRRC